MWYVLSFVGGIIFTIVVLITAGAIAAKVYSEED